MKDWKAPLDELKKKTKKESLFNLFSTYEVMFKLLKTLLKSLSQIHLNVKLSISVRSDFDLEETTLTNIHILSVAHSYCDFNCVLPCSRPRATHIDKF